VRWKWYQWNGRNQKIEREEVRYRSKERWKRIKIQPPSIEFQILKDTKGETYIISPLLHNSNKNNDSLCHIANMFREISLKHTVLEKNLNKIIQAPVVNLNWNVLPKGQKPWSQLKITLNSILNTKTKNQKYVINFRFESINSFNPNFVAIGNLGFHGYVIFGFSNKNLFVLESIHKDNATYVFDKSWQTLSQKTKAEILNQNLHIKRIIHKKGWDNEINFLLK